jgi:hypothetical protein
LAARVSFGVALVALAVALGSALLVVVPRLHYSSYEMVPGEFLYFGAVRVRSVEELRLHLDPAVYGGLVAEPLLAVSHQAKRLADIAWSKHRWLRVSFAAVVAGAASAAAGVLISSAAGGAR